AVRACLGFRAGNCRAIDTDPDRTMVLGEQGCCPNAHPARLLDPAIFQSLIDAGPGASEPWRERQFRQRACLRFTAQRIPQFKEGVRTALITLVDLMTKLFECVKVHFVSVLCLVFSCKEPYFIRQFLASQGCLLLAIV